MMVDACKTSLVGNAKEREALIAATLSEISKRSLKARFKVMIYSSGKYVGL
jgi:hypothetical protein